MKIGNINYWAGFSKIILLLFGFSFIILFLLSAFSRMGFPFELEWLEGLMVDQTSRVLAGLNLYVSPSVYYVPALYPPFYFYVSAVFSKLFGVGFFACRLVSFVSALGIFWVIFLFVKKQTGKIFPALLAVGLFAATYKVSWAWFDLARIDTLFVFLLLSGFYIQRFAASKIAFFWAGVCFSLAFLTKQTAITAIVPVFIYLYFFRQSGAYIMALTFVIFSGAAAWVLNWQSGGWFWYYVFHLPGQIHIIKSRFLTFWTDDLIKPLSISMAFILFFFFLKFLKGERKQFFYYLFLSTGLLATSWFSLLNVNGAINVLLPAYALIAIMFGLAINELLDSVSNQPNPGWAAMEIFVYLLCILQFASLTYNFRSNIPTAKDLEKGQKLINKIARIKGEVYLPNRGYLPVYAGKKSYAHTQAIHDVLDDVRQPARERLIRSILRSIRKKEFAAILMKDAWLDQELEKRYLNKGADFLIGEKLYLPVSGSGGGLENFYVPR